MSQDQGETEDWKPLYARTSESGATEFTRLYPGVPQWMRESLWGWLRVAYATIRRLRAGPLLCQTLR